MCSNYTTCLDVAGALNWDNFTCRGCSGEIDQTLLWRAKCAVRKDRSLSKLFKLPIIETVESSPEPQEPSIRTASQGGKL